jgi:hypothetical protein
VSIRESLNPIELFYLPTRRSGGNYETRHETLLWVYLKPAHFPEELRGLIVALNWSAGKSSLQEPALRKAAATPA